MKILPRNVDVEKTDFGYKCLFFAMASPCEVLIESNDKALTLKVGQIIAAEAWRIEDKYSRYKTASVCSIINSNAGKPTSIDDETHKLLQFADQCFQLSDGLFDITSGVLRKCWLFNGGSNIPTQRRIDSILPFIGWRKVSLTENSITLLPGMEIDFGGIGKEYAVDRSLQIGKSITSVPILVNFGGDLTASSAQIGDKPWQIGVEHPGFVDNKMVMINISKGAIATSGNANRFLIKDGIRYSHILNPKTGQSIIDGPKSITVSAPNCIQAGFIATLALLKGHKAEQFLKEQDINHWCIW